MIYAALDFEGRPFDRTERESIGAALALGCSGSAEDLVIEGALLSWHGGALYRPADRGAPLVLFEGELHDRGDLARALDMASEASDAALYAAAWARFGEDCDRACTGRYVALVVDPGERRIRASCSPIEAPPLHWTRIGSRLVVSSTPRALFASGAKRQLDWDKFDDTLIGHFADPRRGWFRGLERIPPGYRGRFGSDQADIERYWSMEDLAIACPKDDREVLETTAELLQRGITAATTGFGSPALALSGGLDSQLLGAFLSERAESRIPAFCAVPQSDHVERARAGWFEDEGSHARALAAMHPLFDLRTIHGGDASFDEDIEKIFLLGSVPPLNPGNLVWLNAMLDGASDEGCDVLLHGGNGNLTLSHEGMDGFGEWIRRGELSRAYREALALPDERGRLRRLAARVGKPLLPAPLLRLAAWRRRARTDSPFDTWSPMSARYARTSGKIEILDASLSLDERAGIATRAERLSFADMATAEGGDIELGLELTHGVAIRSPMAYRPFVEYCLSLPPEYFLRDGVDRWLAREMGRGRIPEEVRCEGRRGLQGADWPMRIGRDRERLLSLLRGMRDNAELARRLDLDRLERNLAKWDGTDTRGSGSLEKIGMAIPQAIVLGGFARFVEGANR